MPTIEERVAAKAARTRSIRSLHPDELAAHAPDPFAVDLVKTPAYGTPPERDGSAPERTGAPWSEPGDPGTDLAEFPDDVLVPAQPVPVQVRATALPGELRPIVPGWMKTSEGRRNMTRWWLIKTWHGLRFYTVRAPGILFRVLVRTPRGAYRGASWLCYWSLDVRADPMEQELAAGNKGDAKTFLQIREDRARRIRARLVTIALVAIALAVPVFLVATTRNRPIQAAAAGLLVVFLGRLGTDPGRPLITTMLIVNQRVRELTDAIVMRGLRAAGLGGNAARIDKDGNEVAEDTRPTLAAPITRSANGRGYEVLVDLPYGKTAGDAAAAVDRLASGLDVGQAQVFPEPVIGSERRVRIYVADEDPMTLPPHRSPLAKMPKVSVWEPQPIARTPAGAEIRAPLMFNSYLLGAVPRAGKSFAAKCLVVPAVLDPHCDLTVMDCGGGRDWLPTGDVAVDYVAGDEEDDLALIVTILERLRGDARSRLASFRTMTNIQMPEDKLTRELAEAGMRPQLIVVDEIQNLLRAPNKEIRKAALEVLTWLAKTAPKAGYSLVSITQRPAADVIPSDFRDITSIRIALRTKTRQGSDAILGSDISATGYRTDRFMENHKGAAVIGGIPTGKGGDLQVARTDLLVPADFARACLIGRQRRLDAGTLRGAAVGEQSNVVITVTVIDDVLSVWPGDEPKVQGAVLLERLKEIYPGKHTHTQLGDLTKALKSHGVPVIQVYRDGSNANGYSLAALEKASTRSIEA